ncbi:hypothetical protein H3H36_15705 [Duganella sp. FT3S]|uniref:Uncharacterized protein n=1 Tax=Rugamonas fusca TaxID=2758568 RepID=A0A7W2I7S2_9BURK|nr:hypothetical protein [Rugamonas fusca]MBA5606801.1 hypothetical protein [Rugamonas fusca]
MVSTSTETTPLYIPLGIPAGSKQKAFYAYLNSEWDKRSAQSSAVFNDVDGGGLELEFTANFKEQFGNLALKLQFITVAGGKLEGVTVSLISAQDTSVPWREVAYEFITSASLAAMSERMSSFFMRRKLYYVGPELDGEYWFGKVRFAPAEPIPSEMPIVRWERAVFLDFTVDAIDDLHAMYLANQLERVFSARLSLLLNVDLYPHSHEQVWVHLPDGRGNARCNRGHRDDGQPRTMPRKGQACPAGATASVARQIFATEKLKVPTEARRFLRAIDQCEPSKRQYIDGAARLYQIGLSQRKRFPSAALAYSVATIDALRQTINPCSINEFLTRFSPLSTVYPDVSAKLWGDVRNAHFHAGGFALGEFEERRLMDAIIDADAANQMHVEVRSWQITREAIVNWIVALASGNIDGTLGAT